MNHNKSILWITRTAVFIALLIVSQVATAPLGNQLITGPIVNFILIISVMTCGLASGLSVAAISPVAAKLFLGIGPPFWSLIPFMILGNMVLVTLWHFIGNRKLGRRYAAHIAALAVAATAKFLVLYLGIVKIAVPVLLLGIPEKQAAGISATFSVTQLFTALIGGVFAVVVLPTLKKAIQKIRK